MKNKIKWMYDRWKFMIHPYEELYRINQFIQLRIVNLLWERNIIATKKMHFKCALQAKYSKNSLLNVIEKSNNLNKFTILNESIEDILKHDKWNYDVKNKIELTNKSIHRIGDYEKTDYEVKYVYELSRLYQIPNLYAHAMCKDDDDLKKTILNQLDKWKEDNQFLKNIAWKNGNVVGIRAVNLVLTRILLELDNYVSVEFLEEYDKWIFLHYKYLVSHYSLYSSRGNHHIGELVGVIAICSSYEFENSKNELAKAIKELKIDFSNLVYEDGMNKEQSLRYQASYINLIAFSMNFAEMADMKFADEYYNKLEKMYETLYEFKNDSCQFMDFGDNDSAELVYPYTDPKYNIYESMINDYGVVFDKDIIDENYHFDFRNYMLLGDKGLEKYNDKTKINFTTKETKINIKKESGYFFFKSPLYKSVFDIGLIGLPPAMTHGHSDILSFSLYVKNYPVIVDMGSYQYNPKFKKYRDYFRGVKSHNTISINGDDQAIHGEGMFWRTVPKVHLIGYSTDINNAYCAAEHDGYIRQNYKYIHNRRINFSDKKMEITDTITGNKEVIISYHLPLHSSVNASLSENKLTLTNRNNDYRVTLCNDYFVCAKIIKGDIEGPAGWYSEKYDKIEPTNIIIFSVMTNNQIQFKTTIEIE